MNNIKANANELGGQPDGCPTPKRQWNFPKATLMRKALKPTEETR
jgi:hypothetical protein